MPHTQYIVYTQSHVGIVTCSALSWHIRLRLHSQMHCRVQCLVPVRYYVHTCNAYRNIYIYIRLLYFNRNPSNLQVQCLQRNTWIMRGIGFNMFQRPYRMSCNRCNKSREQTIDWSPELIVAIHVRRVWTFWPDLGVEKDQPNKGIRRAWVWVQSRIA